MLKHLLLIFCAWLFWPEKAAPQAVKQPVGQFLEDSLRIGDSVRFALTFRYPSKQEVLFPDSSSIPSGFELLAKHYFPTVTTGNLSRDSAIYVLRSFDLSPYQLLRLPVFLLRNGDSTVLYSTTDSVALVQLVKEVPPELQLAENTAALPLPQQFNYPYWLIGTGLGLLIILLLVLLFGKSIRRRYELYMTRTKFRAFQSRFTNLVRRFERFESVQILEEAVTLWKNYLTDLEEVPINSFTTKEIAEYYNEEELSEVLKLCDRAIYGNIIENEQQKTTASLFKLGEFSVMRYNNLQTQPADAVRATA